jgi:hypothetical protein
MTKSSPQRLEPARTAILFAGAPRWCKDTDLQLKALKTTGQVDWYVVFWAENYTRDPLVSPQWSVSTPQEAILRLEANLPQNHKLAQVQMLYPHVLPPIPRTNYTAHLVQPQAVWRDYWCLNRAALLLKQTGRTYDLVIRSRPELAITAGQVNLDIAARYVKQNPLTLVTPCNLRFGAKKFCEHWAMGSPQAMHEYTDSVFQFDHAYMGGTPYHPAHLLGALLGARGLDWPQSDFEITVRDPQTAHNYTVKDWGRWL